MEIDNKVESISKFVDDAVKSRWGIQSVVVLGIIGIVLTTWYLLFFTTHPSILYAVFAGMAIAGVVYWGNVSFEKRFAKSAMPILCEIAGEFQYHEKGNEYHTKLLMYDDLFRSANKSWDDNLITGMLGNLSFRFWSSVVKNLDGDNSKTIFKGYIIELSISNTKGEVLIRPTRSSFMRGIESAFGYSDTKMHRIEREIYNPKGADYAVLIALPDQENEVRNWAGERIRKTNDLLANGSSFYGLIRNREQLVLAIEGSCQPFQFRGLFSSKEKILNEVNRAMEEILLPAKIIELWL